MATSSPPDAPPFRGEFRIAAEADAEGRTLLREQSVCAPFHLSKTYWTGVVAMTLIGVLASVIDLVLGTAHPYGLGVVGSLAALALIYPAIALYAKRWHDRDKSGWWTLIMLVPIVGAIWLLVECGILPGTKGPNRFGPDPLRLYLTKEVPYGADGDFTWERFEEKYNADLANNLGNLVNRVASMADRYRQGRLDAAAPRTSVLAATAEASVASYREAMERHGLHDAAAAAFRLISATNEFVAASQPWALAKDPAKAADLNGVLYDAAEAVRIAGTLLRPFMPASVRPLKPHWVCFHSWFDRRENPPAENPLNMIGPSLNGTGLKRTVTPLDKRQVMSLSWLSYSVSTVLPGVGCWVSRVSRDWASV